MNALESIKVAIEFVSKQVDPGGGVTATPVAQTGDFAIFAIIGIALICALTFVLFKLGRVYRYSNETVSNYARSRIAEKGRYFAIKVSVVIAIFAAFITCLCFVTSKAITANASSGLVVQPDKIQIPIDEATGQPDPVNFKFVNDSTDYYLFSSSLMSLTDDVKSITSAEDWGINITSESTTIYSGNPDGQSTYKIENIQTIIPAHSMDSVLSFTKFDVESAKKLIGKQVFELSLNYSEQNVAPNPKVNTDLVYNGKEQIGVEQCEGYILEGATKAIDANSYNAIAKLAEGYDVWEDGTTTDKTITWSIDRALSAYTQDNNPAAAENLYYTGENLNLLSNNGLTQCGTIKYSTDDGETWTETPPIGKDAKDSYVVKVKIVGDSNHYDSNPITFNVKIGKVVVKKMIVSGAIVTASYDGNEHMCPENPYTQPFYTVKYEMEQGYEIKSGVKAEYVLTDPILNKPVKGTEIGIYYLGLGLTQDKTYKPYYADTDNVEIKNWEVKDGFLKINKGQKVKIEVTTTLPESQTAVFLGDEIKYAIKLKNNTHEKIDDGKLYIDAVEPGEDLDPIEAGATLTLNKTHTVEATDFIYPNVLYKNFLFECGEGDELFYNYAYTATPLDYKKVDKPIVENNLVYRGEDKPYKPFENLEGCFVKDGTTSEANAGSYYTLISLLPGYKWKDNTNNDIIVQWSIKKFDLNLSLMKAVYNIQYGDNWTKDAKAEVVYTPSEGIPDEISDVFSAIPSGKTDYQVGDSPKTFDIDVDYGTLKNINYKVTTTKSSLIVAKREIEVQWTNTEVTFDGIEHWPSAEAIGTYASDQVEFTLTAKDSSGQDVDKPINPDTYKIEANIKGIYENKIYVIKNAGQEGSTQYCSFVINPSTTTYLPKAILTRENKLVGTENSLLFVYDNLQWVKDPILIEEVFNVTPTSFDPTGNSSQYPSWHGKQPKVVKIDSSFKEFIEFPDTQATPFTSIDLWFADMQNLEKIEGLENIHSGITSLNATFMNTKLDEYSFPAGFFNTVSSTHSMFKNCEAMHELDVSDWNYTNFTNTTSMFEGCTSLFCIYCAEDTNWSALPGLIKSDDMFKGCTLLHKHSTLNLDDKTYARVDKDNLENQGYFVNGVAPHDPTNLYEYTLDELKAVSHYLEKHYTEESTDPVCVKFRNFRNNGLSTNGSDNAVDIKSNPNKNNHWAIDEQGRIASDPNFEVGCDKTKTIQVRIIGICEDVDKNGNTIGLTMMTTHALNEKLPYNNEDYKPIYGWAGEKENGKCGLQAYLNQEPASLNPLSECLFYAAKPALKGYAYTKVTGKTPDYSSVVNKFWAPSMMELYGLTSKDLPEKWPVEHEGNQYKAFVANNITCTNTYAFINIDAKQDGSDLPLKPERARNLWTRSPMIYYESSIGDGDFVFTIQGSVDGRPINWGYMWYLGIAPCFCI